MRKAFLFGCISFLSFTSCAIYKQDFDCPPPCGVPCTSETDLESMVVETNRGPDLFVPEDSECLCSCRKCKKAAIPFSLNRKIWICHHLTEEGCGVQGHYIYQTNSCGLEVCDLEEPNIQWVPSKR